MRDIGTRLAEITRRLTGAIRAIETERIGSRALLSGHTARFSLTVSCVYGIVERSLLGCCIQRSSERLACQHDKAIRLDVDGAITISSSHVTTTLHHDESLSSKINAVRLTAYAALECWRSQVYQASGRAVTDFWEDR
jgi:hypothetical protein